MWFSNFSFITSPHGLVLSGCVGLVCVCVCGVCHKHFPHVFNRLLVAERVNVYTIHNLILNVAWTTRPFIFLMSTFNLHWMVFKHLACASTTRMARNWMAYTAYTCQYACWSRILMWAKQLCLRTSAQCAHAQRRVFRSTYHFLIIYRTIHTHAKWW